MHNKAITLTSGFKIFQYQENYEEYYCNLGHQLSDIQYCINGRCELCDQISNNQIKYKST